MVDNPPIRCRLPNRRRNETHSLVVNGGGTKLSATIGFDETGKPAEVFLTTGKVGSAHDALLGDGEPWTGWWQDSIELPTRWWQRQRRL